MTTHNGVWLGGGTHRPGHGSTDLARITPRELAERERYERRHEPGAQVAHNDRSAELAAYRAAADGRCHKCGEMIGEVVICAFCGAVQKLAGQRNQAKRKTIGGFCGQKKPD